MGDCSRGLPYDARCFLIFLRESIESKLVPIFAGRTGLRAEASAGRLKRGLSPPSALSRLNCIEKMPRWMARISRMSSAYCVISGTTGLI